MESAEDADQPARGTGGVKIDGVTYTLTGMDRQFSSYRSYIWSWWYSAIEAKFYFIYPGPTGRKFMICTETTAVCTEAPSPTSLTFAGGAQNRVFDSLKVAELQMGTSECNPLWYFKFDGTSATGIDFLNPDITSRPPTVYDASDGNIYQIRMDAALDGAGGAALVRHNLASGVTTSVPFTKANVDTVLGGSSTTLIIIIVAVAAVVLLLVVAVVMRKRMKKKPTHGAPDAATVSA